MPIHPSTDTHPTTLTMMPYVLQYQDSHRNQHKFRKCAGLQKMQVKYLKLFPQSPNLIFTG